MLHIPPEAGTQTIRARDTGRRLNAAGNGSGERPGDWSRQSAEQHPAESPVGAKDVLVVEDEPYLCDLIADVLEAEGHIARKASNGLDALQMISERKPQLVLLDLMMPVMDGWEFMSELRANPAWGDVPVVIITAVYDVTRTQDITDASAVITKPFDIEQLSDVVRRYSA